MIAMLNVHCFQKKARKTSFTEQIPLAEAASFSDNHPQSISIRQMCTSYSFNKMLENNNLNITTLWPNKSKPQIRQT